MLLIFVFSQVMLSTYSEENDLTEVFVKLTGEDSKNGTSASEAIKSMTTAYNKLKSDGDESVAIKVVNDTSSFIAEVITFNKKNITIMGVNDDGSEITEVSISCSVGTDNDFFTCEKIVEFMYLNFEFKANADSSSSANAGEKALIASGEGSTSVNISHCKFSRPKATIPGNMFTNNEGTEDSPIAFHLVKVGAGALAMNNVECTDDNDAVTFSATPFLAEGTITDISLIELNLKKIVSSTGAVVKIVGNENNNEGGRHDNEDSGTEGAVVLTLDKCTFAECGSTEPAGTATSGVLYFESNKTESKISVGNTGAITFSKCACAKGKSGGMYIKMTGITDASKLTWPEAGTGLVFTECTAGEEDSVRNTGLYLEVPEALIGDIAKAMKDGFAKEYTMEKNDWFIAAKGADSHSDIDFTALYFDPHQAFAKNNGTGEGRTLNAASSNLAKALTIFDNPKSSEIYVIKVVKDEAAFTADSVEFDKKNITIMGVGSDGNKCETDRVDISCSVGIDKDFFTCKKIVEFMYLNFEFKADTTVSGSKKNDGEEKALIVAGSDSTSLNISHCKFTQSKVETSNDLFANDEPQDITIGFHLVKVCAGKLNITDVECADNTDEVRFSVAPFLSKGALRVTLESVTLKKIASSTSAVVKIAGESDAVDVYMNGCTFSECKSEDATGGILDFESDHEHSLFTVNGYENVEFENCSCVKGKSGGIYLKLTGITEANQLTWPETDLPMELIFKNCTIGESESVRNTGLYLEVPERLYEEIAAEMKKSFAADYTLEKNDWFVAAKGENDVDIDFTAKYFDPPVAYVKKGGEGKGKKYEEPKGKLSEAYKLFDNTNCGERYFIKVIKNNEALEADAVEFDKESGITIEGVDKSEDVEIETEVEINCDAKSGSDLFTCKRNVEFNHLAFKFPASLNKNEDPDESVVNGEAGPFSLIASGSDSELLAISNCRFVRPVTGEEKANIHLVKVSTGALKMSAVVCADDTNEVKFQESLFDISCASDVDLEGVDISKVSVINGATISIKDETGSISNVNIEGLTMKDVKSENGASAGIIINMTSESSSVKMGRANKCSFKSCTAPAGNAGAMYVEMSKATAQLLLPLANNLDIDNSNTAHNSSVASLCIVAPDFDAFSKQEGAFEFAKDYTEANAGWVVGAADENSEPEDVYEKYLKKNHDDPKDDPVPDDDKKANTGVIVAIVVPIVVVVVVVAAIAIIAIVIVRRKRSLHN
ncbi:uncharacterized protein MONOS_15763 [Monocercomonoides exilis]|uniref:uncharacterized protein n=1 Tax=Monocercomonoides exilis TaxID=2049356 RepID=UPI00355A7CED|nr:hypothetical protein MONOS_15763 [Monocercomonoides exilis]|eukprot:MONOS_15763.1-p1 / transcript=MONOS_15763.1 / gene=MONOS_15763 / organism=Monocercomonoides_exilis_PA203 / gene_product=unspecified product / transcript_product=unspecified product / location=Mono_scaffold01346:2454-6146(-) / protein_length=1231 / sequence_SO=supercontig / SO=protein_coding / is_pseudo=false